MNEKGTDPWPGLAAHSASPGMPAEQPAPAGVCGSGRQIARGPSTLFHSMFAAAGSVWLLFLMLILWLPVSELGGLNLNSPVVQAAGFALGAVLLALVDRPPLWRRDAAAHRFGYLRLLFRRRLLHIAALLAVYAAILELAQYLFPGREFRLSQLAANAPAILAICAAVYIISRLLLDRADLGRSGERQLAQVVAAYRREAIYAGYLRDMAQAAHAICLSRSLPAADKVEEMRRLLDNALGAEVPNPDEDVLDMVFGRPGTELRAGWRSPSDAPAPPLETG
jgi:hypothetical protein